MDNVNTKVFNFKDFYANVKDKAKNGDDIETYIKECFNYNGNYTNTKFFLNTASIKLYVPINMLHSTKLSSDDKDMLITWIALIELIFSQAYFLECSLMDTRINNTQIERIFYNILPHYMIKKNIFKNVFKLALEIPFASVLSMFNQQPKIQNLISKLFAYMNIKDKIEENYICIPFYLLIPYYNTPHYKLTLLNKFEGNPKPLENVDKIYITLSDISQRYELTNINEILVNSDKGQFNFLADKYAILNLQCEKTHSAMQGDLYCINPNLAKLNGMKQLSLAMCLKLAGINEKELKKEMISFHKLNPNIVSIGLGGTMSNFFYWIDTFSKYFSLNCPIDKLVCLENDELSFHNLPRIPLDYLSNIRHQSLYYPMQGNFKAFMLLNYTNLYKEYRFKTKKLNVSNYIDESSSTDFLMNTLERLNDSVIKKTFIIGTPDLETRQGLYRLQQRDNFKIPIILPGHQNNDLTIFANPEFKSNDFLVETYGSINLTMFFINMIIMTYEIIKYINKYKGDLSEQLIYNKTLTIDDLKENLKDLKEGWVLQ